jgi:diaminopimelate decarboxylase/aspartate kinase
LLLRIDPGEGRGHHKYVHTAGAKAKFGIWPSQLGNVKKLAEKYNVKIIGLHAHVGSNIFKTDTWSNAAQFLCKIGKDFPEVKFIDAGGGLGVVEKPGQSELDIVATNENLKRVKNDFPQFEFWIEPGRFVVANAGVLLAKVTQTKQKGDYFYIGTNAGMNSLIRPALYGAYHQIVNLSRIDEKPNTIANIVGPICESGDILGYAREIVGPNDGDIILIDTVGAYGRVMSSNYNMREPAEEYFLSK